jgi:hypothetical protein
VSLDNMDEASWVNVAGRTQGIHPCRVWKGCERNCKENEHRRSKPAFWLITERQWCDPDGTIGRVVCRCHNNRTEKRKSSKSRRSVGTMTRRAARIATALPNTWVAIRPNKRMAIHQPMHGQRYVGVLGAAHPAARFSELLSRESVGRKGIPFGSSYII